MLRALKKHAPHLLIINGDISYADKNHKKWDQYESMMQEYYSEIPTMACVGNHEKEDGKYKGYLYKLTLVER